MKDSGQLVRNPKLKILMVAVMTAMVVNAIISAFAPTILGCAQQCDPMQQNWIIQMLIKFGLIVPRVRAYSHIQKVQGLIYPWPALAFFYGVIWLEYLVGIAIAWPVILFDCLEWQKTYDFVNERKAVIEPRTLVSLFIIVIAIILWSNTLDVSFSRDQRSVPDFSTNMAPALELPGLFMLSNFLFGGLIRLRMVTRAQKDEVRGKRSNDAPAS